MMPDKRTHYRLLTPFTISGGIVACSEGGFDKYTPNSSTDKFPLEYPIFHTQSDKTTSVPNIHLVFNSIAQCYLDITDLTEGENKVFVGNAKEGKYLSSSESIHSDELEPSLLGLSTDNQGISIFAAESTSYILTICNVVPEEQTASIEVLVAADVEPFFCTTIYLRGNFNNWGLAMPMTLVGNSQYKVVVSLEDFSVWQANYLAQIDLWNKLSASEEEYQFKIADESWSGDMTFTAIDKYVEPGISYDVDIGAGASKNAVLQLSEAGNYRFTFTVTSGYENVGTLIVEKTEEEGVVFNPETQEE